VISLVETICQSRSIIVEMAGTQIKIPVSDVELAGELHLRPDDLGLTLFAHGSGSSRRSPRNQYVARVLREAKVGTLLFDLMTAEEEQAEASTRHLRFDIPFLAKRLETATRWALDQATTRDVNIGFFGSSTGAAAALVAAANIGPPVSAVVSRGGRPDLAGDALDRVTSPTLLIVGGDDTPVIPLNEEAYDRLRGEKALRIVPGASHLFEEPGTLEIVAKMAAEWFADHLQPMVQR
jgi:pimeloyl-ACP methyl ester carboxylesterase